MVRVFGVHGAHEGGRHKRTRRTCRVVVVRVHVDVHGRSRSWRVHGGIALGGFRCRGRPWRIHLRGSGFTVLHDGDRRHTMAWRWERGSGVRNGELGNRRTETSGNRHGGGNGKHHGNVRGTRLGDVHGGIHDTEVETRRREHGNGGVGKQYRGWKRAAAAASRRRHTWARRQHGDHHGDTASRGHTRHSSGREDGCRRGAARGGHEDELAGGGEGRRGADGARPARPEATGTRGEARAEGGRAREEERGRGRRPEQRGAGDEGGRAGGGAVAELGRSRGRSSQER